MARKLTWEVPFGFWPTVPYWEGPPGGFEESQNTTWFLNYAGAGGTQALTRTMLSWENVEDSDRDFMWVERIVGQVAIVGVRNPATSLDWGGLLVHERIHVGMGLQTDEASGTDAYIYQNPLFLDGAEERFLFTRHCVREVIEGFVNDPDDEFAFGQQYTGLTSVDLPYWSTVDVRVGRSLRPPFSLGYTLAAYLPEGMGLQGWAWLRLLVSRGG